MEHEFAGGWVVRLSLRSSRHYLDYSAIACGARFRRGSNRPSNPLDSTPRAPPGVSWRLSSQPRLRHTSAHGHRLCHDRVRVPYKRQFHQHLVGRELFPDGAAHGCRTIVRLHGTGFVPDIAGHLFRSIRGAAASTDVLRILPHGSVVWRADRRGRNGPLHSRARETAFEPAGTPGTEGDWISEGTGRNLTAGLAAKSNGLAGAAGRALGIVDGKVRLQAYALTVIDAFHLVAWTCVGVLFVGAMLHRSPMNFRDLGSLQGSTSTEEAKP